MEYYRQSSADTLHALDSTPDGLTQAQADERLARDGHNVLEEPPKPSVVKRFFAQLADPMILVLLAAALVSAVTSAYAHESFADVIIILLVVIINAVLGVYQESKAEQAIAALKALSAAHSRVLRGGKIVLRLGKLRGRLGGGRGLPVQLLGLHAKAVAVALVVRQVVVNAERAAPGQHRAHEGERDDRPHHAVVAAGARLFLFGLLDRLARGPRLVRPLRQGNVQARVGGVGQRLAHDPGAFVAEGLPLGNAPPAADTVHSSIPLFDISSLFYTKIPRL